MSESFNFKAIGRVHSCYSEKFGVPRQAGLVESAESIIEFYAPYNTEAAFRELRQFSHIWVVFVFHQNLGHPWQPTVRPPRLGGNETVGVFASRSPFRPNPVGLSAVRLLAIECDNQQCLLRVAGGDMVDGTPVIDIKPYLPYADRIDAVSGYATEEPVSTVEVRFSDLALAQIADHERRLGQELRRPIIEILGLDPRPAYRQHQPGAEYGVHLYDFNLRFHYTGEEFLVTSAEIMTI